jgi:hypothetical protein
MSKSRIATICEKPVSSPLLQDGLEIAHSSLPMNWGVSGANPGVKLSRGVKLEFLQEGKEFRGIGRVEVNGIVLRGSRRPMFVELRTPEGVEFFGFEIKNRKETAQGIVLEFSMKARACGLQDWMVHSVRNLRATRDWDQPEWTPAKTVLRLHLRGIEETFDGRTFHGFEYFYEYESEDYPIYRLLDRSSWAIGGSIPGNTFWLRNSFAPSIRPFTNLGEFYSTEWYVGKISNPNIFQFQPFQTNMESFTMTTAEQGQLLTLAPELSHIRSFFEKPRDTAELLHWHEHCNDLSSQFSTAPIRVLFCDRPATQVELINLNEAVRNHISDSLHSQAGLRRERVTTYGGPEEWTMPDLDDYTDRILPKFLEAGIRCIFMVNQFQNNMNVWNVSNMCCTVDYKMLDSVEENKFRRFCARAKAGGASVQMWGNTSISALDVILRPLVKGESGRIDFLPVKDSIFEILDQVKDPYIRNPSGAIEADHYTPAFAVLNLRDPAITAYWHKCWKDAHDRIGIEGVFLDSSFNLSSDKFHFSYNAPGRKEGATADQSDLIGQVRSGKEPAKSVLTMYFAHLQLIAEMQRYGYHYSGEDIGVFGLRRSGPGIERRLDSLYLWSDCYVVFDRRAILTAGRDPDEVFFQGLACRLMWQLCWDFGQDALSFIAKGGSPEDQPTPWHVDLYRIFNEVGSLMLNRTVLEGELGVVYESEGTKILWAFRSFDFALPCGATAQEILSNKVFDGGCLHAEKHRVYRIH